jgi:hypothetical protein
MAPHPLALAALAWLSHTPSEVKAPMQGALAVRAAYVHVGLGTALETARACAFTQPGECKPLLKNLEAYSTLAKSVGELSPPQVQQLLQLDREISPDAPGEITQRVVERYVSAPLELARYHLQAGNADGARIIALQVLEADPSNREAQRLASPALPVAQP